VPSALLVLFALIGAACGAPGAPSGAPGAPAGAAQAPSPTALPGLTSSPVPSPVAASAPAASPQAKPSPPAAAAAAEPSDSGRVRVANTEGEGANLRSEPNPNAPRVRGVPEGTELEVAGPDQEAEGRRWRNVRDPADGASGWIVADFLVALPPPTPAPAQAAAPGPTSPAPAQASPAAAGAPAGAVRRIDEADNAYIESLRPHVTAFGTAMTAATQQMETVGGRPAALEDPAWRTETQAAARSLADSANGIRATRPGPNTGRVHDHALKAADRMEEAARLLGQAVDAKDARAFAPVRTALLRALSEINAMSGAALELQS
jgi:Bacterial SH3 domain